MEIPNINNLIDALNCTEWVHYGACEHCKYNYQYLDDSGDHPYWSCDEERQKEDSLFFLNLYKHLMEENNKKE